MHNDIIHRFRSTLNMPNILMFDDELRNYYKLLMPNEKLLAKIRNKLLREELNYDIVHLKSLHSIAFSLLN
uniref:Uncharacterized protein n=1 Tax=Salix viminalis TaxID=40686 RepID=A0A6N2MX00_SALVM